MRETFTCPACGCPKSMKGTLCRKCAGVLRRKIKRCPDCGTEMPRHPRRRRCAACPPARRPRSPLEDCARCGVQKKSRKGTICGRCASAEWTARGTRAASESRALRPRRVPEPCSNCGRPTRRCGSARCAPCNQVHRHRLTDQQAREVRSSPLAGVELARLMGVSNMTISQIRRGKIYRTVK